MHVAAYQMRFRHIYKFALERGVGQQDMIDAEAFFIYPGTFQGFGSKDAVN